MKCLLIILFCLTLTGARAQPGTGYLDSLPLTDTGSIVRLIEGLNEVYLSDPERALALSQRAFAAAKDLSFINGEAQATGWMAYLLEQKGEIDAALAHYQTSLGLLRQLEDHKNEAEVLNNMAAMYKDQGRIDEALATYEQSIEAARKAGFPEGLASTLNNVGLIYEKQGQLQLALQYYSKSLEADQRAGNEVGVAVSLYNLAVVYFNLGLPDEALNYVGQSLLINQKNDNKFDVGYSLNLLGRIYGEKGLYPEAIRHFQQALDVRQSIGDVQGQAYTRLFLGDLYEKLDSPPARALTLYHEGRQMLETLGSREGMAGASNRIARAYLKTGQIDQAIPYAQHALALARKLGFPAELYQAAGTLGQLYRQQHDWPAAVAMDDLYIRMKDSIQNEQIQKTTLKSLLRSEFERKQTALLNEQETQRLLAAKKAEEQRLARNFLLAGLVILIVFSWVLYRQRNRLALEKLRSDSLLLNILPAETAEELKRQGHARARRYDQVTVLFTDFKDFTSGAELLGPEELVQTIHQLYCEFDRITTRYNLEKIKTIGDSYMAAGGLFLPGDPNPGDSVQAALEMRDFMQEFNENLRKAGKPAFEIRIGLHTGPVVAGVVGEKKFAFDIWGDTVNTAARLEQQSAPGKVNISGSTYAFVHTQFNCTYRGRIEAKNKGQLDMYFAEQC